MRRRYARILIGVCLLTGGVQAAPAAARGSRRHQLACPVRPKHLVIANGQAEVYVAAVPFQAHTQGYFGCEYKAGRSRFIGSIRGRDTGVVDTRNLQLVGKLVAFESYINDRGISYSVVVLDLAKGRSAVRKLPTGNPTPAQQQANTGNSGGLSGVGHTTALVLKNNGAVAWIVHDDLPPDPPTYEVIEVGADGQRSVVAMGTDITPDSLALSGGTLYWTQGNAPHSAVLN